MRVPHYRKMTWVLIGWSALVVVAAIAMALGGASTCASSPCQSQQVGVALVFVALVGVVGLVVLGSAWLLTRPRVSKRQRQERQHRELLAALEGRREDESRRP
jgi:cytochrome bd-type quinol oxidase subunit 2